MLAALDRLDETGGRPARTLIVLCAGCRRARDESRWVELETYLIEQAGFEFSHGLCPDCLARRYPGQMAEPD